MLNRPKFLSPSINMYGNTVIDLNSASLPFSCILDGNEAITDWQIVVSRLTDNTVVFDTGKQTLKTPFFPINNRNQNVVFNVDLKEHFVATAEVCYIAAESTYDPEKVYYSIVDNKYVPYAYDKSTWDTDYTSLYYTNFVNSADAYYWAITFSNSKTGSETQSVAEVFYANSIPETKIYYSYDNNFYIKNQQQEDVLNPALILSTDVKHKSVLEKRKIFLKSSYAQAEKISLKRYGWRLTDITNNVVVIDTISQNQIYGVEDDISCVCNGLVNETSYLAELYVETQNGYFNVLQSVEFDVNYTVKNIDADFEIVALNDTSGIMLNWGNLRTTEGVIVGSSVSYAENFPMQKSDSIEIPNDTSVVFAATANGKDLNIDESSYVVLSFQFDKTQDMTLFEMSGLDKYLNPITRKLIYTTSDRKLKYTVTSGNIISSYESQISDTINELCWYVITLYPLINNSAKFKLVESIAEDGLFPDEDLYPEEELTEATEIYNPNLFYFTIVDEKHIEYVYNPSTWNTDWKSLYCCLYPHFGEWNKLRKEVV